MPEPLLAVMKLLLLALVYLFFARVLRAVWAEMSPKAAAASAAGATAPTATGAAAPKPPSRPDVLRVVEPKETKGQTYPLGDEVTVGRASGCQILLAGDSTVSQLHARIFRRDGKIYVEDLGSTNGTFLNRKKVSGPMPVRRGDRLQVGQTVLEVAK